MADQIGEPFNPDDDKPCASKDCKTTRYENQMRDGAEAIRESSSVIQAALDRLDQAAKKLEEYGDAPMEELEPQ